MKTPKDTSYGLEPDARIPSDVFDEDGPEETEEEFFARITNPNNPKVREFTDFMTRMHLIEIGALRAPASGYNPSGYKLVDPEEMERLEAAWRARHGLAPESPTAASQGDAT